MIFKRLVQLVNILFFWYHLFNYGDFHWTPDMEMLSIGLWRKQFRKRGIAVPISISAGGHLANRIGEHSNARGKHLLLVEISLYRELFIRQTAPRKSVGMVNSPPCPILDETRIKFHRRNPRENVYGFFDRSIH